MNASPLTVPFTDPVAFYLGPIAIYWYSLSYLAAIGGGWILGQYLCRLMPTSQAKHFPPHIIGDIATWAAFSAIIGGRLGHVLFYDIALLATPLEIINFWDGGLRGMSFHGGFLGACFALYLFAAKRSMPKLLLGDLCFISITPGLAFGRIANFINGELWGRPTDMPWGMVFLYADEQTRHPSQLYEAGLEGIILFIILLILVRKLHFRRPGIILGTGLMGYAIARSISEFFREPEIFAESLRPLTYGMVLSLPMIIIGMYLIITAMRRPSL